MCKTWWVLIFHLLVRQNVKYKICNLWWKVTNENCYKTIFSDYKLIWKASIDVLIQVQMYITTPAYNYLWNINLFVKNTKYFTFICINNILMFIDVKASCRKMYIIYLIQIASVAFLYLCWQKLLWKKLKIVITVRLLCNSKRPGGGRRKNCGSTQINNVK